MKKIEPCLRQVLAVDPGQPLDGEHLPEVLRKALTLPQLIKDGLA